MGWRDVIWPKRFIYQYLKELMGRKAYANLYTSRSTPAMPGALKKEAWDREILTQTVLGKQLSDTAHDVDRDIFPRFRRENLQHHISWYWLKHIRGKLVG